MLLVLGGFCLPWPLPRWRVRRRLLWRLVQSVGCVAVVPLCSAGVAFVHVVITDTLTSTCLLLWQLESSICLFSTSSWINGTGQDSGQGEQCIAEGSFNHLYLKPVVYALPFWLRFCQSLHTALVHRNGLQALNALKYLTALSVVFTSAATNWDPTRRGTWHAAWIASLVVKTVYCYTWDVVVDWGLLRGVRCRRGRLARMHQHPLLRSRRWFRPLVYYAAMTFNIFGRVAWSIAISPAFCGSDCTLVLGLVEVVRRSIWLLLRVELQFIDSHGDMGSSVGDDVDLLVLPEHK